jgi:hypothetical protein
MRIRIGLVTVFLVLGAVRGFSQEVNSVFDQQVAVSTLHVRRIAVIPNRLPLVLQEAEMWRQKNWEIIRRLLEHNGFEVVPYADTVDAARTAGLPLEDTFSSEDKFHTLCQVTGADLVIMPYYGTSFRTVNFLFLVNTYIYSSIVSYQFYSPEVNLFFHRADAQGEDRFSTGWAPLIGIGLTFLPLIIPSDVSMQVGSVSTITTIGGVVSLGGTVFDLVRTASPPNKRWERGFEKAIAKALGPFLAAISPAASGWQEMAEPHEKLVRESGDAAAAMQEGTTESKEAAASAEEGASARVEAEAATTEEGAATRDAHLVAAVLQESRKSLVDLRSKKLAMQAKRVGQARGWLYAGLASLVGAGISYGVGSDALSSYRAATDLSQIGQYRTTVETCQDAFYVTAGIGGVSLLIGLLTRIDAVNYKTETVDKEILDIDLELSRLKASSR